jgi:hypothetical protein
MGGVEGAQPGRIVSLRLAGGDTGVPDGILGVVGGLLPGIGMAVSDPIAVASGIAATAVPGAVAIAACVPAAAAIPVAAAVAVPAAISATMAVAIGESLVKR